MKHLGGGRAPRSQRRTVRWAWLAWGIAVAVSAAAAVAAGMTPAQAIQPPPGGGGGSPTINAYVTSPASNQAYSVGQDVPTQFLCQVGGGAVLVSCTDSNGVTSPGDNETGDGTLVTSAPGQYTCGANISPYWLLVRS
jgi:hypothetical protein